jgi:hypothetical protein
MELEAASENLQATASPPRLSVIIPVHNGAAFLERCLGSMRGSTFRDYECIVVDDASTDTSRDVALKHGARLIALERRDGPARARNRGVEHAGGDIVVFLDADVCVHADTLARLDSHFREHPAADAVIGSYDDAPADPGFVSQFKNLFHHYVHHQSRAEAWTFWAGCGAIRRQVFQEAGGFDEAYTRPCVEDIELGFRLRAAGRRIDLNSAIQVTHLKRWTFWRLMRTDLLDRGVPWLLLMLRARTMPPDLNVTLAHRLSVALVLTMVLVSSVIVAQQLMALRIPGHAVLSGPFLSLALVALAGALVVLNYDLYRFFARKRGVLFAAGAVPLHWLYYGNCGLAVGLGVTVYLWGKLPLRRQIPSPQPSP